jgi:hypothetical protein
MNAFANALLVREPPTRHAGLAVISTVGSTERTRPTMTWHIGSASSRPVSRRIMTVDNLLQHSLHVSQNSAPRFAPAALH